MPAKKAEFHYPGGFTTESAYRNAQKYSQAYGKEHFRRYQLRMRYYEENDLIDFVSKKYNLNQYIIGLIAKDKRETEARAKKQGTTVEELLKQEYAEDKERYGKLQGK